MLKINEIYSNLQNQDQQPRRKKNLKNHKNVNRKENKKNEKKTCTKTQGGMKYTIDLCLPFFILFFFYYSGLALHLHKWSS